MSDPSVRHNARDIHFGPEQLTAARVPAAWRSRPSSEEDDSQLSLFSEEEIHHPPHHTLSPHQFAAQKDVWWHGRYGEDLPSDSYKEGREHFELHPFSYDEETGEWEDKSGYQGIHFGTRKAAEERLTKLGPGRPQSEDEPDERVPGRFFPVTLNKEKLDVSTVHQDAGMDWRPRMGYDEPEGKGILYENEVEDRGSVSAVVPERSGRSGHFFRTWNDHVTETHDAGGEVHPMLLDYARKAPEHTGEDFVHPEEPSSEMHRQGSLFEVYGSGHNPKYLDADYKNTLGPPIKVPSQTIQRKPT